MSEISNLYVVEFYYYQYLKMVFRKCGYEKQISLTKKKYRHRLRFLRHKLLLQAKMRKMSKECSSVFINLIKQKILDEEKQATMV